MSARARPRRRHGRRVQTPATRPRSRPWWAFSARVDPAFDTTGDLVAVVGDDREGRIVVRIRRGDASQSSSVGEDSRALVGERLGGGVPDDPSGGGIQGDRADAQPGRHRHVRDVVEGRPDHLVARADAGPAGRLEERGEVDLRAERVGAQPRGSPLAVGDRASLGDGPALGPAEHRAIGAGRDVLRGEDLHHGERAGAVLEVAPLGPARSRR